MKFNIYELNFISYERDWKVLILRIQKTISFWNIKKIYNLILISSECNQFLKIKINIENVFSIILFWINFNKNIFKCWLNFMCLMRIFFWMCMDRYCMRNKNIEFIKIECSFLWNQMHLIVIFIFFICEKNCFLDRVLQKKRNKKI